MKILIVAGKLTYSNKTTYTLDLVRGLVKRDHKVVVVAPGGPLMGRLQELGVEVLPVRFNYFSFRRLLGFLREFGAELMHATGGSSALDTARRLALQLGVPLIHTIHSWLGEDQNEDLPASLRGVIVINQDLREHLVNERSVPKGRIQVIPYGVDGNELVPRIQPRAAGRIPVVGAMGRLARGRRYDDFLRAARLVIDAGVEAHFMLAGEGPDENRLRQLAKELKLDGNVTFVQPQSDPSTIYAVLDLLVVVSDWGGVGLTLLEGMACGLPVIATSGGEVFSILGQGNLCILVRQGDQEQLSSAIQKVLREPDFAAELGRNARQFILRQYPLEEQVARVVEYYQQVLTTSS